MIEVRGNLWSFNADARVITTNGTIRKDGHCVMGKGCALEAAQRDPTLPKRLGDIIKSQGNHVGYLGNCLWSFPVKHNWWERADPALIKQSAEELVEAFSNDSTVEAVVLPRPGCGNGGLQWGEVELIIRPILDDRFHVITF